MPSPTIINQNFYSSPDDPNATILVRGRVMDSAGAPVSGATIEVHSPSFDRELTTANKVATKGTDPVTTSPVGYYEAEVLAPRLATMVVHVTKASASLDVQSRAYFHVTGELHVDVITDGQPFTGRCEIDQIVDALDPLMPQPESAVLTFAQRLAGLEEEDLRFLCGQTGIDPTLASYAKRAVAAFNEFTTEPSQFDWRLFYVMFREGLPLSRRGVLAQGEPAWRAAVQRASDAFIVPAVPSADLEAIITALRELQVAEALTTGSPLRTLLDSSGLDESQLTGVVSGFLTNKGSLSSFWSDMATTYDSAKVAKLQFALQIGTLTGNHVPLANHLLDLYEPETFNSVKKLADKDAAAWKDLMVTNSIAAPVILTGPDGEPDTDPARNMDAYSAILANMVEDAFPTAVLVARNAKDLSAANADTKTFFAAAPDFDVDADNYADYVAANPGAVAGITGGSLALEALQARVEKIQRLSRVVDRHQRYEQVAPLLAAGVHSAASIVNMGYAAFKNRFGTDTALGPNIEAIYDRAQQITSTALAIGAQHAAAFGSVDLPVTAPRPETVDGLPTYASLFGSVDYCACEDCRSVYGPAAYLVDLMHFLDQRQADSHTVLEELTLERRPDLPKIKLTCANTNTAVPYIDLVNEILEDMIAPTDHDRQTTGSAANLALEPEHINADAYYTLSYKLFPWSVPFHFYLEQSRTYLRHLGIDPTEMMRVFRSAGSEPADSVVVGEQLGIAPAEYNALTSTIADNDSTWGLVASPAHPNVSDLASVKTFLTQSGMKFDDLAPLFQTKFVNPTLPGIHVLRDETSCSLNDATIAGLGSGDTGVESALHRIQRFVRLQRRLGWTAADLDRAIVAFTPSGATSLEITPEVLAGIAGVVRLRKETDLPVEELLTWFAPLGTYADSGNCQYDRVFQNPAVLMPMDTALALAPGARPTDIDNPDDDAADKHAPSICAALGLTTDEYLAVRHVIESSYVLTLDDLSMLYRHASLARATGLSMRDLQRFIQLSQRPVFDAGPDGALAFVRETRALHGPRAFSLGEIDYLLYHHAEDGDGVMPADEAIKDAVNELRERVAAVPSENADGRQATALTVLAAKLGVTSSVLRKLTLTYLHSTETTLLLDTLVDTEAGSYEARVAAYVKAQKAALLVRRLGILTDDLACVFDHKVAAWLDPDAVPTSEATTASATTYDAFARLRDAFVLRDAMVGPQSTYCDVVVDAINGDFDPNTTGARLVSRTLWDFDTVGKLITAFYAPPPGNFDALKDEVSLRRLHDAFSFAKRIGEPPIVLVDWAKNMAAGSKTAETAAAIRRVVRARYTDDAWPAVAKPLRDSLRQKQRDALVAYATFTLGLPNVDALFAHLLVDPEMCACGESSRVRLALNSIQTYVQRILMNLEPGVSLSPEDAREWSWMKNYSVWAANRQVFLYPENWLDPSLRADKTPFFAEFESALQQNDPRADTVPEAFASYLAKLETVARMEICASTIEPGEDGDGEPDVLHVFARTNIPPRSYFYRRYIESEGWTPWEPVGVDFKDAQVTPVVFNRRLRVYWMETVMRGGDTDQQIAKSDDDTSPAPVQNLDVRLAFSEYHRGKWSPRKTSDVVATLSSGDYGGIDLERAAQEMFLRTEENGADLVISLVLPSGSDTLSPTYRVVRIVTVRDGVGPLTSAESSTPELRADQILVPPGTIAYGGHFRGSRNHPDVELKLYEVNELGERNVISVLGTVPDHAADAARGMAVGYTLTGQPQKANFDPRRPLLYQHKGRAFLITTRDDPYEAAAAPLRDPGAVRPDATHASLDAHLHPDGHAPPTGAVRGLVSRVVKRSVSTARALSPMVIGQFSRTFRTTAETLRVASTLYPLTVMTDALDSATAASLANTSAFNPPLLQLGPGEVVEGIDASTSVGAILGAGDYDGAPMTPPARFRYQFTLSYHPYARDIARQFNRFGVAGLLAPPNGSDTDLARQEKTAEFFSAYEPDEYAIVHPYPVENIDFEPDGAYSAYNWELFFYAPFLIAERLRANRQFAEAQRWYHFIFDPTRAGVDVDEGPRRYWQVKPLFEAADGGPIDQLLQILDRAGTTDEQRQARERLEQQVNVWRRRPFDPDVIARLRPTAFQRAVVMRYLDNLIEWGDDLFRRDTLESINEATQLYLLAAQILGDRPVRLPENSPDEMSYAQIKANLDDFSNAVVRVEHHLPPARDRRTVRRADLAPGVGSPSLQAGIEMYFCVPPNSRLLAYWDRVADRLFKIRHCLNIEGVAQTLPLFEPPIDPGLLVRAAAQGVSLASALADATAQTPPYRFSVLYQRAVEFCGDVRGLGSALLSALEKRDAEALAALRSTHESQIAKAIRTVRDDQVQEAEACKAALERSRDVAKARKDYYDGLISGGLIPNEKLHLSNLEYSATLQDGAQAAETIGTILSLIPNFDLGVSGWAGSPVSTLAFGGAQLALMAQAEGRFMQLQAGHAAHVANVASIKGSYDRRLAEWTNQADLAAKEMTQLDAQITAAEIRIAVAKHERDAQDEQLELAQEADDFLQSKYTRTELYDWMSRELMSLYTQAYSMAYEMAKRAQKAWEYDLGETSASFIQYGSWDDRRSGLLAGERLLNDLRRMEAAYLAQNTRQFEITKHISLQQLDPVALLALKETGTCSFDVPEVLFDLEYPDHWLRRIKSVAITMPGVTGPYTSVACKAALSSTRTRRTQAEGLSDDGLSSSVIPAVTVTSQAQNDSGLFETNHHDERYLPFEGYGVVGTWTLDLPKTFRSFNYDTISDVVITLRYTARGGRTSSASVLPNTLNAVASKTAPAAGTLRTGLFRAFSLRQDFPDQWEAFVHPAGTGASAATLPLTADRFPVVAQQGETIDIKHICVVVPLATGSALVGTPSGTPPTLEAAQMSVGATTNVHIVSDATKLNGIPCAVIDLTTPIHPGDLDVQITATNSGIAGSGGDYRVDPDKVADVIVIVQYQLT